MGTWRSERFTQLLLNDPSLMVTLDRATEICGARYHNINREGLWEAIHELRPELPREVIDSIWEDFNTWLIDQLTDERVQH